MLHYELFPMRELDEALNLIKEKCDITRDKDGIAEVTTTGLGANFNKTKLEKELGIRLFSFLALKFALRILPTARVGNVFRSVCLFSWGGSPSGGRRGVSVQRGEGSLSGGRGSLSRGRGVAIQRGVSIQGVGRQGDPPSTDI